MFFSCKTYKFIPYNKGKKTFRISVQLVAHTALEALNFCQPFVWDQWVDDWPRQRGDIKQTDRLIFFAKKLQSSFVNAFSVSVDFEFSSLFFYPSRIFLIYISKLKWQRNLLILKVLFYFKAMNDNEMTPELMLERQIFLINQFNLVYNVRKSNEFNLNALKGSILDDAFIDITFKNEPMEDGTTLSTVTILNINAEFVGWAKQEQDSMEKAMKKAIDYLTELSNFINCFKKCKFDCFSFSSFFYWILYFY